MNKMEIAAAVAEKLNVSKKDAAEVLNASLEVITDALKKGDKVLLVGFGSFEVRKRAAREGRNPQKPGQTIKIPATKVPVFKAGKSLKETVAKKKK